jgi:hypothetical protein
MAINENGGGGNKEGYNCESIQRRGRIHSSIEQPTQYLYSFPKKRTAFNFMNSGLLSA